MPDERRWRGETCAETASGATVRGRQSSAESCGRRPPTAVFFRRRAAGRGPEANVGQTRCMWWQFLADAHLALADYPVTAGILAGALVFVALHMLFPEKAAPPPKIAATNGSSVPRRDMAAAELRCFNGVASEHNPSALIFVCVRGDIFNVTSAAHFYGAPRATRAPFNITWQSHNSPFDMSHHLRNVSPNRTQFYLWHIRWSRRNRRAGQGRTGTRASGCARRHVDCGRVGNRGKLAR